MSVDYGQIKLLRFVATPHLESKYPKKNVNITIKSKNYNLFKVNSR